MAHRVVRIVLALACAALLFAGSAQGQDSAPLAWKLVEGTKRTEIVRTRTKQSAKLGDTEVGSSQDQIVWALWEVGKVAADGSAKIVKTIKRVRVVNTSASGQVVVDTAEEQKSTSGPAAAMAEQFGALVGAKVEFNMLPDGSIKDVALDDKLAKSAGALDAEQVAKQSLLTLPKDLAPGKVITSEVKVEQGAMTLKVTTTYTYEGATKEGERFDCAQRLDFTPKAGAGFEVKVHEQSSEGELLFDRASGWAKSLRVALHAKLEMAMPRGGSIVQTRDLSSESRWLAGEQWKQTPQDEKMSDEQKGGEPAKAGQEAGK